MSAPPAIKLSGLTVRARTHFFSSPKTLLNGIHLEVGPQEICGFVGANGAGKSTTMRVLLGLIRPSHGSASLFGVPVHLPQARVGLGFLPERSNYPRALSPLAWVLGHGMLSGLDRRAARRAAEAALDRVGLLGHANEPMRQFSKGMLQRAGLAQAIIGNPRLLILDEPLSGLDPWGRHMVRELIGEMGGRGCAVFFSTHVLADVELICDRVVVLERGQVTHAGTPEALWQAAGAAAPAVEVVAGPLPEGARTMLGLASSPLKGGHRFLAPNTHAANALAQALWAQGHAIRRLGPYGGTSLESLLTAPPQTPEADHA